MADYPTRSYWLGADPYRERPRLEGEIQADVAVVGGGYAGLSTAYELRRADPSLRVVVLEAEVVGYGASGRNAGFVMPHFGLTLSLAALRFGRERVRAAYDFLHHAVDHVGALASQHGVACDYEQVGLLTVATTPAHVRRLLAEIRLAEELGIADARWLDAAATRTLVDSPTYLGARFAAQCALVNPAKLVRGLADLAERAGAVLYERSPVLSLAAGPRLELRTPRGSVRAERAVLALNAYAAQVPALRDRQLPVFTYVVLTEPLRPEQLATIGWRGRQGIEDGRHLFHYYRLTPDNRLLVGGGDALYFSGGRLRADRHPPAFDHLERFITRTFPGLRGARITHRWGGPVSVPLDFAPAFGYLGRDRRVVYSLGCVGHGVALMTSAGQVLRDLVLGRATALTQLCFVNRWTVPLPPEPLRFATAQAIRSALRVADWLDDQRGRPR